MSIFRRSKPRPPAPVKVAWAYNQAEAELIEQILAGAEIPCLIKRNNGFDVPDMLAAGARDIYVPAAAAGKAKELLAELEATGDSLPGS